MRRHSGWLASLASKSRVIVAGTDYDDNVNPVGADREHPATPYLRLLAHVVDYAAAVD